MAIIVTKTMMFRVTKLPRSVPITDTNP